MAGILAELARSTGVAAALLLVGAGAVHLVRRARLRALLRAHGIVPPRLVRPVAAGLGVAQLALGAATLVGAFTGGGTLRASAAATAAVFIAFTGYLAGLVATRPGSPCGCLGGDEPAGGWSITRAALGAIGAGVLAAGAAPLEPAGWAAAALLAAMSWAVPALTRSPAAPSPGGAGDSARLS